MVAWLKDHKGHFAVSWQWHSNLANKSANYSILFCRTTCS